MQTYVQFANLVQIILNSFMFCALEIIRKEEKKRQNIFMCTEFRTLGLIEIMELFVSRNHHHHDCLTKGKIILSIDLFMPFDTLVCLFDRRRFKYHQYSRNLFIKCTFM